MPLTFLNNVISFKSRMFFIFGLCMFRDVLLFSRQVVSDCFVTKWTVAHQAPLSMGFYRQELGVGCHFRLQGIFPTQGLNLNFLSWPTVSIPLSHRGSPSVMISYIPSVRKVLYTSDIVFFLVYVVWRYMISTCLPFVMLILPDFSTVWVLSFFLANNKQPVVRCFKTLQISCSLSKFILQIKVKTTMRCTTIHPLEWLKL